MSFDASMFECNRKPACSSPNDSILAESDANAEAKELEKEVHCNSAESPGLTASFEATS
jgi:hypothetical protein